MTSWSAGAGSSVAIAINADFVQDDVEGAMEDHDTAIRRDPRRT
jgi:hypothetical protein